GSNLALMNNALSRIELPDDLRESLRNLSAAELLVLGSAIPDNIDHIRAIDAALRPGQGSNDRVLIIDRDPYPLTQHRKEWDWLRPSVRGPGNRYPELQYPAFRFKQADMRELPVDDGSTDVAVSDYTLNFLPSFPDVEQTFSEVARVLRLGG